MSRPDEIADSAPSGKLVELEPGAIHIWYARPAEVADPTCRQRCEALLCPEEQARLQRYRLERVRHEYLTARALVRRVLSRYTSVEPQAWRFVANPYGKPEIESPTVEPPLRFNLSHTRGLVVLGVTRLAEIGVDVEWLERATANEKVARRYFSKREVADLMRLPHEQQAGAFFDYWTLKEAYIKACGRGLAIPLDHFSFDLSGERIGISFTPKLPDDPASWYFTRWTPTPEHRVAVAVRWKQPGEPSIREFEFRLS